MSYYAIDGTLGVDFTAVDTTQNFPLGKICQGNDTSRGGGEFIYLQGVASTAAGSWVFWSSDDYSTALAATTTRGELAVAMAATVASTYGWYQITGKASGKAATGFADNADVYLTATAGTVDDADVAGAYIHGAKGASAVSGGLADFEISRPHATGAKDN